MAELQRNLWVVKMEEVYDPYFCYRWDLLENWLPEQVRHGHALSREDAVLQVVAQSLKIVIASQERTLARLFDLSAHEVEGALARLAGAGLITREGTIRNLPDHWVLWLSTMPRPSH